MVAAGIAAFGQLVTFNLGCGGENCKEVNGVEVCCNDNQAMDSRGNCVPRK